MDRIDEIVKILNANILYVGNIQDAKVWGITEKIQHEGKTKFFEKKANGVMQTVSLDDSDRVTILHWMNNLSTETDYERGTGNYPVTIETSSMSLLLYYTNPTNSLVSREILEIVKLAFPATLKKSNKSALGIKKILFNITESRTDKYQIFDETFVGHKNNLSDESILLKIDYQIIMEFDKSCIPFIPCDLSRYDVDFQRPQQLSCADVKECVQEELDTNLIIDGGNANSL